MGPLSIKDQILDEQEKWDAQIYTAPGTGTGVKKAVMYAVVYGLLLPVVPVLAMVIQVETR
jgi:hypothetical protein